MTALIKAVTFLYSERKSETLVRNMDCLTYIPSFSLFSNSSPKITVRRNHSLFPHDELWFNKLFTIKIPCLLLRQFFKMLFKINILTKLTQIKQTEKT